MDVFDYGYYEESTDANGHRHRSTYRFDCVATSHDAGGASLTIDEENVLTLLADAVALDDLTFESEEFNRSFNVRCDDERFAHAFVDARMMEWLLAYARGCRFAVTGNQILVVTAKIPVHELQGRMSTAAAFVARIPRVVASLYPGRGRLSPNVQRRSSWRSP